jgi:hypothetical protein
MNTEVGIEMGLERVSPKIAARFHSSRFNTANDERGEAAEKVILYTLAIAGTFAIALVIYNALKNKATTTSGTLDNPPALPAN